MNTPTPRPTPAESSEEESTAVPTPVSDREYDSVLPMSKIFQGISSTIFNDLSPNPELALKGLESARINDDKSMVPVIVTLMRFINQLEVFEATILTLNELTGQDFGDTPAAWPMWFEWVGANLDDYRPPDGYPQLKRRFLAGIHPGFEQLLDGYENTSRIEPFEIEVGRRRARRHPAAGEPSEHPGGRGRLPWRATSASSACRSTVSIAPTPSAS